MPGIFKKKVLSASRRTDIPAFYMDWFMDQLKKGRFQVENPYSKVMFEIPVSPNDTHTIVFWSKNFSLFLEKGYGEILQKEGYHLFFNYTVNSEDCFLEPLLPRLNDRIEQFGELARRFGPRSISWRFDPICHYRLPDGTVRNNLKDFALIASKAAEAGIERCITSFADLYGKVLCRVKKMKDFSFIDPSLDKRIEIILDMERILEKYSISLSLCCEKDLANALPNSSRVRESACISTTLITELFGGDLSFARDQGQRKAQGCGCQVSKDIGSYTMHPCYHNCLFCYANPVAKENEHG